MKPLVDLYTGNSTEVYISVRSLHDAHKMNLYATRLVISVCPRDSTRVTLDGFGLISLGTTQKS